MPLLASLSASGGALNAFGKALEVMQNNVGNASTPGYVRQDLELLSVRFDPESGLGGGVKAGRMTSARSEYAEQSVRRGVASQGRKKPVPNCFPAWKASSTFPARPASPGR